jgi:hypothetical protein
VRNVYTAIIIVFCVALTIAFPRPRALAAQQSGQVVERNERLHEWERQQEKLKNKQRHEDLKKDTDKLLQLATDLKLAVDKSNEQTLSMDVMKKAEEVEKLAKSIQKKMKGD